MSNTFQISKMFTLEMCLISSILMILCVIIFKALDSRTENHTLFVTQVVVSVEAVNKFFVYYNFKKFPDDAQEAAGLILRWR